MNLPPNFPALLTAAAAWIDSLEQQALAHGRPLAPHELALAHHAGVREPQRVRVLELDHFPQPADPALCAAAKAYGLLSERTCGLTAGYGILVRRGMVSMADARVLSHECRHVQQYEVAGSTLAFLTEYLGQIVEYGYWDAPLEKDACGHEVAQLGPISLSQEKPLTPALQDQMGSDSIEFASVMAFV